MRNYLILLFAIIVSPVFAQDPPEKYQEVWQMVNEMDPNNSKTNKKLEQLRKENPNDPWIYWISGINCNPVTGNEAAAIFYKKAIEVDSTFPHAYYNLAVLDNDTTEQAYRNQINLLTKALKYDANLGFAFIVRGDAHLALGELDQAMQDCLSARKTNDIDPMEANRLEVEILWKQNKKKEAFKLVRKSSLADGMWGTDFSVLLASIYEEMGEHEKACMCYYMAAEPFDAMEMEVPAAIAEGVKKCQGEQLQEK